MLLVPAAKVPPAFHRLSNAQGEGLLKVLELQDHDPTYSAVHTLAHLHPTHALRHTHQCAHTLTVHVCHSLKITARWAKATGFDAMQGAGKDRVLCKSQQGCPKAWGHPF